MHDDTFYPEPEEIVLQLTHRDVVLDFFKNEKDLILSLRSGMPLYADGEFMTAEVNNRTVRILKLSKACIAQLSELNAKGYYAKDAEIRFVVAWKGEDDTEETAIVLPNITLKK